MPYAATGVGALTTFLIFLVAIAALRDWLRFRERTRANLAFAIGALGLSTFTTALEGFTSREVLTDIATFAFLASGFGLLLVRNAILPVPVRRLVVIAVAVGLTGVLSVADAPGTRTPRAQLVLGTAITLAWIGCVAEPIVRFWFAARGRAVVQRARLRAFSAGFAGIVALLIVSVPAQSGGWDPESPAATAIQVLALPVIGFLAASFSPPAWLRRYWRNREERSLLADAPPLYLAESREACADSAVRWASRLTGADAAVLVDGTGEVLARHGADEESARDLADQLGGNQAPAITRIVSDRLRQGAVAPMRLDDGTGALIVLAGPLTPTIGREELAILGHLANGVGVALDNARLTDMKTTFLTAISHEIRTPLTSIVGMTATLRRSDVSLDDGRRAHMLDRIGANAAHLDRMVTDLLDLDRLERGVSEPRCAEVDLAVLIRNVVERRGSSERTVVREVQSTRVRTDPAWVERIVENLLANTDKHTPAGTKVWVRVEQSDVGSVTIVVEDDGPGVRREQRSLIFEPFVRGREAPAHSPGTGVGLALVARLVQRLGGSVTVQDRDGGGASFRVWLPGGDTDR